MPASNITKKYKLNEHIRSLILKEYYLPYATVTDLIRIPSSKLCNNLDAIKRRAIEILVKETEEAELYRQLIYTLSTYNVIVGLNPYRLAYVKAQVVRKKLPFSHIYKELEEELSKKNWWKKIGYKDAVETYADLIQLNFAYTSLEHLLDGFLEPQKKQTQKKVLIASLASKALIGRLPLRPFESTAVDENTAEKIVNFCIELRKKVVEGFLILRPKKAGDIFHYIYQWAKKESEKLEKLGHLIIRLDEHIYEEIFLAPYFLHHYGILNLDLIKYDLFWEIER
jgi:hypothetical protein